MTGLPQVVVTFLFTDIEGSTRLWERHAAEMSAALRRHDDILRAAIEAHGGVVFKTIGDAVCAAFADTPDALAAAIASQRTLDAEPWPAPIMVKVRMALHTGAAECHANDYFGPSLNRTARLLAAGHGGQVLVSQAACTSLGDRLLSDLALRDMGERRLKDLLKPERIYQVVAAGLAENFPPLVTLDVRASNLPSPLTSFVGRERETAEVEAALGTSRLVTLTGAGGVGKTRLSLEVATSLVDRYANGVCCIELAGLQDASLLPQTVAAAFGIAEQTGAPIADTVLRELADKELLIVLDNCEHLIGAAADFAAALLRASRKVRILATSREALRIAGESVYRVPTLDAPDPNRRLDAASLMRHAAIRLFVERAQAVKRGFSLEDSNAADIAAICRRLDGIPLAIELAAARLRTMSVADANRRLDQRFKLLIAGQRSSLPRQQTLRALIDWSYDLLGDDEKALWRRLAVFAGGWTLPAAEAVCADLGAGDDVADGIAALVDKSLVSVEEDDATPRYRMLQTLQEYASERLDEHGERIAAMSRHLDAFLALAEEAEPHLTTSQQQAWLDRLQAEQDNIRAALAWASTHGGDVDKGMRLAVALLRFWQVRSEITECRAALGTLLADARTQAPTRLRANALSMAGALARQQGEFADAHAKYAESLSIMRACGDDAGTANALSGLALVAFEQGDYPSAREHSQECLVIRERCGDRAGRASPLNTLGNIAAQSGDPSSAREYYEACLALCRELGERRGVGYSLNNLGILAYDLGDPGVARTLLDECLSIVRALGDRRGIGVALHGLGLVALAQGNGAAALAFHREALVAQRELLDRYSIAESLEGIAAVLVALGDIERAARLWGGAERLRLELRSPLLAQELARYDEQVAAARGSASDIATFERAWQQAATRSLDDVIDDALAPEADVRTGMPPA